jgi:hypothetical protein
MNFNEQIDFFNAELQWDALCMLRDGESGSLLCLFTREKYNEHAMMAEEGLTTGFC